MQFIDPSGAKSYAPIDPWFFRWSMTPAFDSETDHKQNDVPGTVFLQATWSALGIQSDDTASLRPIPCYLKIDPSSLSSNPANYHLNADSCDHTWTWSDPAGP
jgi:hypothetical protein